MSDGCCCHNVMVNCGSGGGAIAPPTGGETDPGGGDGPPQQSPPCSSVGVRVERIHIAKSESYALGGEGGTLGLVAEWDLVVSVDGETRRWIENAEDGKDYALGWDFVADIVDMETTIRLRASGVEKDVITADDPLPTAERVLGSSNNWGIGTSASLSATSPDFDYSITYSVRCLGAAAVSMISKRVAVQAVAQRLRAGNVKLELDEDTMLNLFVSKIASRGARLSSMASDMLVWESHKPIQQLVREVFPPTPRARKPARSRKAKTKKS